MDAVLTTIDVTEESIFLGNHHIVAAFPLKDGLTGLKAGMLLKVDTGEIVPCVGTGTEDPVAVLLAIPTLPTSGSVEPVAVHGAIRREKLVFADGTTAITDAYVELLRKNGIYAL
jgi:hypothetical protein